MTDNIVPEFSRAIKLDIIGNQGKMQHISANNAELSALAARLHLIELNNLQADYRLITKEDHVSMTGEFTAEFTQSCIASGEPVKGTVKEILDIKFLPQSAISDQDEIELSSDECDIMFIEGGQIDAGEAVAQSLILALPQFPRSKNAQNILRSAGVVSDEEVKPTGALSGLKDLLASKPPSGKNKQ
ncbi:hypothetical protein LPB140_01595 [Sphingorhabdus lutea]|uniref:DUF177 domain-containing protein n=1 Tax=Sphingorhabdus lutea TaxID=1913578 RepID=A0A1L3J9E0_9SPHN|nr:YceD family protein [Sphingorhabdus lutea]APG61738.1 hypothetical protein LPB140_01595 [Sphingorhabdus lutea]